MKMKSRWCASAGSGVQLVASEASVPDVHTLTPAVPVSVSLPQPQATLPITIQSCPQVRHLRFMIYSTYKTYILLLYDFRMVGSYFIFIWCHMLICLYATLGAVSGEFGHSDDWHDGSDRVPRPALTHPPQRSRPDRRSRWSGSSHPADNQFSFPSWVCGH